MRLKNDLLRAAYNVQTGTQNSYVTGFSVSQNANDAVSFIDHMEKRKKLNLPDVETVTADAVYGTEENYQYMEENMPDMGIKRFLLRGKEKVTSELAIIFIAYNLRKMAIAL